MNTTINFLQSRRKELASAVVGDRKYLVWMSYLVGAVIVIGVVVFGFDFFLQRSIRAVENEQVVIDTQLRNQSDIEAQYLLLAEKVGAVDTILLGRVEKRQTLQFFTSLFLTDDVSIKEMGFQSPEILDFSLVSSDVFTLEEALNKLESSEVRNRFNSLSTTDLNRSQVGEYSLKVTVSLKKLAQEPPKTPPPSLSQ